MISNLSSLWSDSISKMQKSIIRELLKLTQNESIISFAGGLPDPSLFPIEEIRECSDFILKTHGSKALQYGTTEGDLRLRTLLLERYKKFEGLSLNLENLIITTASQQGLDLLGRLFVNPGDFVLCGLPSYLGGINAIASYGAKLEGIELDEQGMRPDLLEERIIGLNNNGARIKFIYIIPDFQNPAGITMPLSRRKQILQIAQKYDLLIAEDTPYREVRFEGESQPMFQNLDTSGQIISLGTFSKVLAPGFRIGWVIAHKDIIDKFVTAKQIADLCTGSFVQMLTAEYIDRGYFDKNLDVIVNAYRKKRDAMLNALRDYMPKEVSWTKPEGGLFLFLHLPVTMDAEKLFMRALKKNVAFVIGKAFYCNGQGINTMRLNFSFSSVEDNVEGIKRLAEAIKEEMLENE